MFYDRFCSGFLDLSHVNIDIEMNIDISFCNGINGATF